MNIGERIMEINYYNLENDDYNKEYSRFKRRSCLPFGSIIYWK